MSSCDDTSSCRHLHIWQSDLTAWDVLLFCDIYCMLLLSRDTR
jgi:hypothetical protein